MKRTSIISLSALTGAAILAAGVLIPGLTDSDAPPAAAQAASPQAARLAAGRENPIVMGHGLEVVDSRTADDWVSGAQHVVVYTVQQETVRPPQASEVERQEGLTERDVRARIDQVVWSKPGARTPPAPTWDFTTFGNAFNDNDGPGTAKFAVEGRPRVEAGHTYIAAIHWLDDPCSDDSAKGRWGSLGSGAILPFDSEIIGQGEFEGRVLTAAQNKARIAEENAGETLAQKLAGQGIDALVLELAQATSTRMTSSDLDEICDPEDATD